MAGTPNLIAAATNRIASFFQRADNAPPIPSVNGVDSQPFGEIPESIKARASGWSQPPNLSTVYTDVNKVQNMIRCAERGDTYQLTTFYRDMVLGDSHIQAEFAKRKMVVLGAAWSVQPIDKNNAEDVAACEAIKLMMEHCENWDLALSHMLDAVLWPVAVAEKIFEPVDKDSPLFSKGIRYRLKEIAPVNPALFCYKLPYIAQGGFALPSIPGSIAPNGLPMQLGIHADHPGDTIYDPDSWEPTIRFYRTFANGMIDFSWSNIYAPDRMRHIVHRGNTLGGVWDNFGGPMRSLLFWYIFGILGRDWWARSMERYGAPFIVVYANAQQSDTMRLVQDALGMAGKLNGLALPNSAKVELKETNVSGMADGFHKFLEFRNEEISKIVLGQTASASQKGGGGLGAGSAQLHSEVRDDLALFDKKMLNNMLRKQIFRQFLDINGFKGRAPQLFFGGMDQGI